MMATRAISAADDATGRSATGATVEPPALDWIRDDFASRAADHDTNGSFPFENFAILHKHGLLSAALPADLGGGGADLARLAKIVRAVSYGDPSTGLVLVMQYLFTAQFARGRNWAPGLRERVLRSVIDDGALVNGLRVEPDLGTPGRGGVPATVVRRTATGWVLNGRKIYSTGAPGLKWMSVWAATDEDEPRIGGVLVDSATPGVRIEPTWNHLGMRATGSHDVVFEDVRIPDDQLSALVRLQDQHLLLDAEFQLRNALLISIVYDSVAHAARDWFVSWLQQRVPTALGAPLSTLPRFQELVGRIEALLYANRLLLERSIHMPDPAAAGTVKYIVTNNAVQAVQLAIDAIGNPALTRAHPLERHLRNVLCSRVHMPQDDIVLTGLGRAAFAATHG
ncbi:acyl-CoA dehydrogenase [Sphingobium indicum F2]|uniref:Acyl-CoA dehydrogenase n=1 Tax=Sphingobium indicum F2 TaxID=1450518 RepID=A0A8E0WT74_9SPHN|nr:acyl-CoA dehydrogenase [Sphingobium indicum F2]